MGLGGLAASTAITIRAAVPDDAEAVARVINGVIAEGELTVFDRAFSTDEERQFLSSLGDRDVVHVAVVDGQVVGVQSVGRFSTISDALRHVATMGTWIAASHRGQEPRILSYRNRETAGSSAW